MFDDLAQSVASTLSGVFGNDVVFTHGQEPPRYIRAVVRKDVELMDDQGQVVSRTNTVRIAHKDTDVVPVRGDRIESNYLLYTLGRRLADDGYAYVFEATL